MAYDLKKILGSVGKDADSIRDMANKILAGEYSASGTGTLKTWAETAIKTIHDYEDVLSGKAGTTPGKTNEEWAAEKLDKAYSWITGAAQPTKAKRMYEKAEKGIAKSTKDLANDASNLAILKDRLAYEKAQGMDTSGTEADMANKQAAFDKYAKYAESLGMDVAGATRLVMDKSGSWIPAADALKNDQTLAAKNLAANNLNAAERQAEIERAAGIATNVAGGSQAPAGMAAQTRVETIPTGERKLGPEEYDALRKQFGATPETFDQYFRRDSAGNIYLKPSALDAGSFSAGGIPETPNAGDLTGNEQDAFDASLLSSLSSGGSGADAFVNSLRSLASLFSSTETTALETERADMTSGLEADMKALEGKGAALSSAYEKAGISDMTSQLQELNLRIAQKTAEYESGQLAIADQTIPMELLTGQQAALKKQQAVDVGMLYMQAAALKDNIDLAEDLADKMIEIEFSDEEQRIANTYKMLELNSDDLSRAESKLAAKVEIVLAERERILEEKKAEKKLNSDLMIAIVQAGGDLSNFDYNASYEKNVRNNSQYISSSGEAATADIAEYEYAVSQGYSGSFIQFTRDQKKGTGGGGGTTSGLSGKYDEGLIAARAEEFVLDPTMPFSSSNVDWAALDAIPDATLRSDVNKWLGQQIAYQLESTPETEDMSDTTATPEDSGINTGMAPSSFSIPEIFSRPISETIKSGFSWLFK